MKRYINLKIYINLLNLNTSIQISSQTKKNKKKIIIFQPLSNKKNQQYLKTNYNHNKLQKTIPNAYSPLKNY